MRSLSPEAEQWFEKHYRNPSPQELEEYPWYSFEMDYCQFLIGNHPAQPTRRRRQPGITFGDFYVILQNSPLKQQWFGAIREQHSPDWWKMLCSQVLNYRHILDLAWILSKEIGTHLNQTNTIKEHEAIRRLGHGTLYELAKRASYHNVTVLPEQVDRPLDLEETVLWYSDIFTTERFPELEQVFEENLITHATTVLYS